MSPARRIPLLILGLATVAVVAACGSKPQPPSHAAPAAKFNGATTPAKPSAVANPKTDSHGLLRKDLGQWAAEGGTSLANSPVRFKVDSIAPVTCTGVTAEPSQNGHFIEVKGVLQVSPNSDQVSMDTVGQLQFGALDANNFAVNGVDSAAASMCLDNEETWPNVIHRGTNYHFNQVLDVSSPHGMVTLESIMAGSLSDASGWGWTY